MICPSVESIVQHYEFDVQHNHLAFEIKENNPGKQKLEGVLLTE